MNNVQKAKAARHELARQFFTLIGGWTMDRRELLGVLGATAAGLAAVSAGEAFAAQERRSTRRATAKWRTKRPRRVPTA